MDFPGRLFAGFLAIILIVIFPLPYIAQSHNENIDSLVDEHTQKIAETIRDNGYINKQMYEDYIDFLNQTGEIYDIDIEDIHPVTGEEDGRTATQKTRSINKNESFQNTNSSYMNLFVHNMGQYKLTFASMPDAILNMRTSTSISDTPIYSLSAHTHTSDCYVGHNHAASRCVYHNHSSSCYCTGTRNVYAGEAPYQCGTFQASQYKCNSCGATYSSQQSSCTATSDVICKGKVNVSSFKCTSCGFVTSTPGGAHKKPNGKKCYGSTFAACEYKCSSCSATYSLYQDSCPATVKRACGSSLSISQYTCNNCGTTSTSSGNHIKYNYFYRCNQCSSATIGSFGSTCGALLCGYNFEGWSCGISTEDPNPICNTVVTGITAANPTQSIILGESISATATATYLDGHTGLVNCTVSNFDSNTLGTQTVTLTYSGLVDNARTMGNKSCTVTVTVRNNISLTSISVTPSVQVIARLGTPTFTVKANYSDGSSKALDSSELTINGFDPSVTGSQTVTISHLENGIAQNATAVVLVNALTGIYANPDEVSVERYTKVTDLPISVIGSYLYDEDSMVKEYTISGYSPDVLGLQNVAVSYTECGITQTTNIKVNVTVLHETCPYCHNVYDRNTDDTDPGCPFCKKTVAGIYITPEYVETTQGESLPITVYADYADGSNNTVTGWTSNYDSAKTGLQIITVEYGGYAADVTVWVKEKEVTCPICKNKYPVSEGKCPVCASTVVSISVNTDKVTVNQYDNINLEVTALYADGTSEAVTDWNLDCSSSNPGTYTVTVTYRNVSTKITLTVMSLSSTICPICNGVYEPSDNPRGCPVCSNTLTGIEAYLTNGSNLVQYGSVPNISVALIYIDNHREITTDGYILKAFNENKLGKQTIIIQYEGFETSIDIEVVNTLTSAVCPNGHVYYLNEDGSDPGCPYCAMADNIGTVYYYDITYLNEILDKIYTEGSYHFTSGNYITINIIKKDVSLLTKIQNTFFKTAMLGRKRKYTYGGEVF